MNVRPESAEPPLASRRHGSGAISPDLRAMDDGIALLNRYWQQLAEMESALEATDLSPSNGCRRSPPGDSS